MSNASARSVKIKTENSLSDLVTWRSLILTKELFQGHSKAKV